MIIAKLDKKYLEFIQNIKPNFHKSGIGLFLYYRDSYIFIPITSQKRLIPPGKDIKLDKKSLSKFFPLGKNSKNGTFLIVDYIYVLPYLVEKVYETSTIRSESIYINQNKTELLKRIRDQINYSKPHSDKEKKIIFNQYIKTFVEKNRSEAIKYTKLAINSMAVLEKINFTSEQIDDLIDYKVLERVDSYEVETVLNIKNAWRDMIENLFNKLSLENIIATNKIIAQHQALYVGKIRDSIGRVSGEFEIAPPNPEALKRYLKYILNNQQIPIYLKALNIFYRIITNQWFFDGNKRTAFVIANKLLIEAGAGIILVKEEVKDEFNELLYNCYKYSDDKNKEIFFKFLLEKCLKTF
ncbi:Fic family protein [Cetobacterium sp.]|uniref:Fic family protein n=1 Tax=Cetobacterium sp. TaxID=2071632 RepID=UPI003F3BBF33